MPIFKCFLSVGFCDHTLNHPSFQDKLAVTHKSGLDTLWVLAGPPICEGVQDSLLSSIIWNYLNTSQIVFAARVEDGDDPAWTQVSASTGQSIVLHADRFHQRELQNPKAKEECMGIKKLAGNI